MARFAGVPDTEARSIHRAIDKFQKIGADGVREEMMKAGIPAPAADAVIDLISFEGDNSSTLAYLRARLGNIPEAEQGLSDLAALLEALGQAGVPDGRVRLSLHLARGLDYYTGPVHETVVREPKIGSITAGGRYDGLVGVFSNRQVPATGVAFGMERLMEVIEELNLLSTRSTLTQALVTVFGPALTGPSLQAATALRAAGLRTEVYLEPRRSLRDQLTYANRRHIPLVAIIGPDEHAKAVANLKRLSDGQEWTPSLADLPAAALAALDSDAAAD
jgi:histidyl-tRNA synthetase